MSEVIKEIDRQMKKFLYVGIAATILLVIDIILFYYERSLWRFVMVLVPLIIVSVSIKHYIILKEEKKLCNMQYVMKRRNK